MIFALLVLLLLTSPTWAVTYYVSTQGNDSNPCTEAQPCATYARARTQLAGGDTLYFRAGTYGEKVQVDASNPLPSGSSWDSMTTIAGYPGETVVLTGGINMPMYNGHLQYAAFRNFHLQGAGVVTQGCGYRGDGAVDMGCGPHYLQFTDLEISNFGCGNGIGNGNGASDLRYRNIRIHDGGCSRLEHGLYVLSPRSLYEHLEVWNVSGYCMHLYDSGCPSPDGGVTRDCGSDTVIRNSVFRDCRGDGAVTLNHGDRIQFYNNSVLNSHNGVEVSYGAPDQTSIHDNTIANNTGGAIHVGQGPTNTHIYNNHLSNNGGALVDHGTGTTSEPGAPPSDPPSGPQGPGGAGPGVNPRLPPRTVPNPALAAAAL